MYNFSYATGQPFSDPSQQGTFQAATNSYVNNQAAGGFSPVGGQSQNGFGGNGGFGGGLGFNGNTLQLGLGALGTLGNLWMAFQQQKLAKDSLSFQKKAFNENLSNQKDTYNIALEDRIRSRYNTEGRNPEEADAYLAKNRL